MSFSTGSLEQLLQALASPKPTPGGGTAAAVAGAMGVSLLVMAAGLARTRGNTEDERGTLAASLQACADRDAEAFGQVMAAYRMPKAADDEKTRRKVAIQAALRTATDVPLETLRLAAKALELGETVARHGNPAAASDIGVAACLLRAAADGAAANVRANLGGLADEGYRSSVTVEVDQLVTRADEARARLLAALA